MGRIFLLICLLTGAFYGVGQNAIGLPEILNYSKQSYGAGTQNWDICQDKDGFIYVANNEGLLSFDGISWRNHPLPNRTIVRSVAVQEDRIYVGGQDELGYFSPDEKGNLRYQSIVGLIGEGNRSFSDVWDIIVAEEDIYFRTNQRIFRLTDQTIVTYTAGNWLFMGQAGGRVLVQEFTKGILQYVNNTWEPLLSNESLPADVLITAALEAGGDSIYFTTLKHGIYLYTGGTIKPLYSLDLDKIKDYYIYDAIFIDDFIALATSQKGCFIVDKSGSIIQQFSRLDGLQNNNILSIFADRGKSLWLGLDNGLDFVEYNSAIKNIIPDKESDGSGYSSIVHDHTLYIATTDGLYSASLPSGEDLSFARSRFVAVQGIKGQVWNLSTVNGKLLVGHHEGFFEVRGDRAYPVDKTTGFWAFLPFSSLKPTSTMVTGTYDGIRLYDFRNGSFVETSRTNFESARFVAVLDEAVWVSHPYKGLYKIEMDNTGKMVTENLSSAWHLPIFAHYVFKIRNRIVVSSENGIYAYDPVEKQLRPFDLLNNLLGHLAIRYLHEDQKGNIWFVFDKSLGVVDFSQSVPRIVFFPELNQKMVSGLEQVYVVDDQNVFVGAEKGFYHINYKKYLQQFSPVQVYLRQVNVIGKTDSLLFGGYLQSDILPVRPTVSYDWNRFHFQFASPSYVQQESTTYSFLLKGFDNDWSDWSSKTDKEYTNMASGSYTFQVKAKDNLGNESSVVSYSFVILPPWYRSWWAYTFYGLSAMYILYQLYRWQKDKFNRQQLRYEEKQKQLRDKHQLELEKSEKEIITLRNEKLEAEIQHKNKEMASATMHLVKKGELITGIKEELQKLSKNIENEQSQEALKKMIKALGEEDKMDADWEHFTIHFDKTHNDFFVALKARHKNLTPNELKLCAYLRMNLSTKEMAQLMNISVRGVEVSRYRLRKKLDIPTETNLFTYLLDFHAQS